MLLSRPPSLDWIQVEVTSHCNAACVYCPHDAFRDHWENRHIPLELFESLLPAFRRAGLVFLQGWGEPLLHPEFERLVRLCKSQGCRVGTNTNGTLLDADKASRLVDLGLDVLAFSLCGTSNEKNDAVRRGTSLEAVRRAIRAVRAARAKNNVARPAVHVAYMLLRSGLQEADELPGFLHDLGAEQAVVSSLSLVVRPEMERESRLADSRPEFEDLKKRLLKVRERARSLGVSMHFHIGSPEPRPACPENIERSLFIGADGRVSPCAFTGLPIAGEEPPTLAFGNANTTSVGAIWRSKEYRNFRRQFEKGMLWPSCRPCAKCRVEPLDDVPELVP